MPTVDESDRIKVEEALEKRLSLGDRANPFPANEAESEIAAILTDGYKSNWQSPFGALFSSDS